MRILLVEDEISLSNAICAILQHNGYLTEAVYDGLSAVDYALGTSYDLIILDVMLPKIDGFEALRMLRNAGLETPILMLTAKSTISDKVSGLNKRADDYMTKPFHPDELLARVGALTRRKGSVILTELSYLDIRLNIDSALLICGDESVQLSKKEFEVLKVFLYNPNMIITVEMLINKVWGADSEATDNNVEVYISFIRKKLKYLHSKVSIKKIQCLGYRLEEIKS